MNTILAKLRLKLRIQTDEFDGDIVDLVEACLEDLRMAGVTVDDLIVQTPSGTTYNKKLLDAVSTYVKMNFGDIVSVEQYDRLKASYDEQKAQMQMTTGYTTWQ